VSTVEPKQDLTEQFLQFYRDYYREEIGTLAQRWSQEQRSLYIEYGDLFRFERDIAEDYLNKPDQMRQYAEEALYLFDLPADVDLSADGGANVRLTDRGGMLNSISVSDLDSGHIGEFVAITGQIEKVTKVNPNLETAHWLCQRCMTPNPIEQGHTDVQEPHECVGCERQGPFELQAEESDWSDRRKLKLGELPAERTSSRGQHRTVYVQGDLCHYGGENGLADRAGEQATILATVNVDTDSLTGQNATTESDIWLDAHSVVFEDDDLHDIDIDAHREEFEEFAADDDAADLCAASIAPALLAEGDEEMEAVMEASVAWLFNGYRVDPEGKGTFRGDLHFALIGDPGKGKSTLLAALNDIAPKSVFRSGTGLSKVGLTAAAVQEEFAGTSEWTLEPGVLPRANGGHCIIDEVDDVVDEKTKAMHDALEGEQMVKVDKAGIEADLPSRTALFASGNPTDGRFDRYEPIAEQIDLDPALISRMDILLSVQDIPDPDHDSDVADHMLETFDELSRAEIAERGYDVDQVEESTAEGPVPKDVLRAWVAYARESVFPVLTEPAKEKLKEFYVEVRDLNGGHSEDGGDDPIPATPRTLEAGIRLAVAFARVNLSDTVEVEHAERAISLSREVVGLNYDPESGQFDANRTDTGKPKSQKDRRKALKSIIRELQPDDSNQGAEVENVLDAADDEGMIRSVCEDELETLRKAGELYEPITGEVRVA
jgi:replicative DNA helicase Mcm